MRTGLIFLISIVTTMELFSQNKPTDRQPAASGRFYPADKETLVKDLNGYFAECKKQKEELKVRAIISPHAGYVFSGKIAAAAFSATKRNASYDNIFLIGSSHIAAFEGASVYNSGDFITPLGRAVVNREIGNRLKDNNPVFNFPVTTHIQDHCLEVQIPFIQYYYNVTPKIVPIIIGTSSTMAIRKIAEALKPWFTPENLFVISSDFSHYPEYDDGTKVDNITATALISGDPEVFMNTLKRNSSSGIDGLVTSMCGWTSGLMLLEITEGNKNLEFKRLDYCNSGDSPYGNKDEVVGYHAIALTEKGSAGNSPGDVNFTEKEKEQLFEIARNSIKTVLNGQKKVTLDGNKMPDALRLHYGAFVTLKINGVLRGCIGRFISDDPLYEVVQASALSSAFEDPRFPSLSKDEYDNIDVEITVLGPMKKISSINEIKLGTHGIYIKKDLRAGTMLPQVATEYGWSVEEFLGYTSRDKAGIGWDGWKNAEIFIYEGKVLEEKRK